MEANALPDVAILHANRLRYVFVLCSEFFELRFRGICTVDAPQFALTYTAFGVEQELAQALGRWPNSHEQAETIAEDWKSEEACETALREGVPSYRRVKALTERLLEQALAALDTPIQGELPLTRSVESKAKDVKHLSNATKQVSSTIPSIIHVAVESNEGPEVERLRTKRIRQRLAQFDFRYEGIHKPVALARLHRFETYQRFHMAFEVDESIDSFPVAASNISVEQLRHVPHHVMVPVNTPSHTGIHHWDLYTPGQSRAPDARD